MVDMEWKFLFSVVSSYSQSAIPFLIFLRQNSCHLIPFPQHALFSDLCHIVFIISESITLCDFFVRFRYFYAAVLA